MHFFSKNALLIAITASALSGCSVMRSYNDEMTQTINLVAKGQPDLAIQTLDKNNKSSDKDLLYYLEKGQLLRFNNQLKDSSDSWLAANQKVNEWENEAKVTLSGVSGGVGSVILNDKVRRYDGHDYEKVMLSTQLALDYVLQGNWDVARTEIKKTHEREAIIEQVLAKDYEKQAAESKSKGITTTFKDLKGYPVATLDSPDVVNLKNGYQSAFSHYLAGFAYEALNEPSLAAPGYRKAIELRPGVPALEDGLAGLDSRLAQHKPNTTDLLLVIESGTAPSLTSITIPLPVIVANLGVIPISFPILNSDPSNTQPPNLITVDSTTPLTLTEITSIDAMSRRALRDDMPGIILRGIARATAKAVTQKAVSDNAGFLAGLAVNAVNVITESADERTWRTLPSSINITRVALPIGNHEFQLSAGGIVNKKNIEIKGSHGLLLARVIGNQVFWSEPQFTEQMPNYIAPPAPEPAEMAKPVEHKKTKKQKHKSTNTGS